MNDLLDQESWLYVIVKNPGADEQIVGQRDDELAIAFIPAFREKEAALSGLLNLPREPGGKYEIQAIIFEDLERHSAENGFLIFLLDHQGRILEKIRPGEQQ